MGLDRAAVHQLVKLAGRSWGRSDIVFFTIVAAFVCNIFELWPCRVGQSCPGRSVNCCLFKALQASRLECWLLARVLQSVFTSPRSRQQRLIGAGTGEARATARAGMDVAQVRRLISGGLGRHHPATIVFLNRDRRSRASTRISPSGPDPQPEIDERSSSGELLFPRTRVFPDAGFFFVSWQLSVACPKSRLRKSQSWCYNH
jgi:hypothetical protein